MFDTELLMVTVARDRRPIALMPSFLGCQAAFGCVVVALVEGAWRSPEPLAAWMHAAAGLVVVGATLTAMTLAALPRPVPRVARLRIDGDELEVDELGPTRRFRLERRRRGWLRPTADGAVSATLIAAGGHRIVARFQREQEALAFLTAAGVGLPHRCLAWPLADVGDWTWPLRLRWQLARRHLPASLVATLAIAWVVAVHATTQPLLLVMSVGFLAAILLAASLSLASTMTLIRHPPSVSVGADGIALEGFGARRFVPLTALTRVEAGDDGVRIHHADATHPLTLPLARTDGGQWLAPHDRRELADPDEQLAMRDALMTRIRHVVTATQEGDTPAVLVGHDASHDDEAVRALLRPSYRAASTSPTELAELLLGGQATPAQRLAAARALATDAVGHRRHLNAALEATADPTLTDALDALVGKPSTENAAPR